MCRPGMQRLDWWLVYSVPLFGILYRSHQSPDWFLGVRVWYVPVHSFVLIAVGAVTLGVAVIWCTAQYRSWRNGTFSLPLCPYLLSHTAVFYIGYVALEHISHGWLVLNVWHNAQYILICLDVQQQTFP